MVGHRCWMRGESCGYAGHRFRTSIVSRRVCETQVSPENSKSQVSDTQVAQEGKKLRVCKSQVSLENRKSQVCETQVASLRSQKGGLEFFVTGSFEKFFFFVGKKWVALLVDLVQYGIKFLLGYIGFFFERAAV